MAVSPSFVALAMRAAMLGSMLLVNAVLSRNLSATDFGAFIFISNISIFIAIVGQFGFRSYIVKEVAQLHLRGLQSNYASLLLKCYLIAFLASLILSSLVFLLFWNFISEITGMEISLSNRILISVAFSFMSSNLFVPDFFRGALYNRISNITGIYIYNIAIFISILSFVIIFDGINFTYYIYIQLFISVLCAAFGLFIAVYIFGLSGSYQGSYGSLIYSSVPFLVSNVATYLMINTDLWVVAVEENPEVVGIYGAAARLALLVGMPVQIGLTIMIGRVAHLVAANEISALERVARRAASAFMGFSFLVAAPLVLVGNDIMRLVYGPGFELGGKVLSTLAVAHFASAMSGAAQAILLQAGQQKAVMLITLLFAAANYLVATWVGAGTLGLSVAIVYATGIAAYAACLVFMARWRLGIWVLPYLSPQSVTGKR